MKAHFTFDEMVYNSICSGKQIYYAEELKTIDYVKLDKPTRQIVVHCTDGDVFVAMQDDKHYFEVNQEKENKPVTKPKLKD